MEMRMSGDTAYLEGSWTASEMTYRNIDSIALSLEQLGAAYKKRLLVDCKKLNEVDGSGLQFLKIWLHCLKLRGVEPELINLSRSLQKAFKNSGFRNFCSANIPFFCRHIVGVTRICQRRKVMKSSTKDQIGGAFHQVKGAVREVAGIINDDPKLEGAGAGEKVAGKIQEKIGQLEKVLGK